MTTTTSYGTWVTEGDTNALDVAQTIRAALGGYAGDYDLAAIEAEYRAAIDAALPEGMTLAGDEFLGPVPVIEVDIAACVDGVDLWAIIERHDKVADTIYLYEDNADSVYLQRGHGPVWSLGPPHYLAGGPFAEDARTWLEGDWEPGESNGQTETSDEGLVLVASYRDGEVTMAREQPGSAAQRYLTERDGDRAQ
jgi:hypothetical protein